MNYNISITKEEAVSLLELGDDFHIELKEVLEKFDKIKHPMGGYKIYNSVTLQDSSFIIQNRTFHSGKKIIKALKGSERIAVLIATIGSEVEDLIREYNASYDFLKAYWCDKLSNWTLDNLMSRLVNEIKEEVSLEGENVTSNWGPGYCGWNITEQKYLLPLSIAEEINITLSSSMLMHPIKSMSGVVGIGENVKFKKSGCADCNLYKCAYRSLKW